VKVVFESYRDGMSHSPQIQLSNDENRSKSIMPVRYYEIDLPSALPIRLHYPHVHPDHPIDLLHVHRCWELGYCFEGSGIFMVGSKVMEFGPGCVSLIGPDEPHLAQSLPGTTSRWAWVYLDPFPLVGLLNTDLTQLDPSCMHGAAFTNLIHCQEDKTLGIATKSLIQEMQNKTTDQATMIRVLVCQILLLFRRQYSKVSDKSSTPSQQLHLQLQRLAPALEHMAIHYHQRLDVTMLAQLCSVSQSHFRKLFTQAMHVSPQDYWQRLRIRMALSLLRSSDQSILQISQQVGFESLSSFNRLFKQIMGTSPRSWRKHLP
tara:strand:- start:102645 stop:103598 length:954 start_codon:yes stop_codon:yes gene_type:complete